LLLVVLVVAQVIKVAEAAQEVLEQVVFLGLLQGQTTLSLSVLVVLAKLQTQTQLATAVQIQFLIALLQLVVAVVELTTPGQLILMVFLVDLAVALAMFQRQALVVRETLHQRVLRKATMAAAL
jgi:hypothetical protein